MKTTREKSILIVLSLVVATVCFVLIGMFEESKRLAHKADIIIPTTSVPTTLSSLLTEAEARSIAEQSCIKGGNALGLGLYNGITHTWWFDANLNLAKPGCNPGCVVDDATKTAEINWRCMGLLPKAPTMASFCERTRSIMGTIGFIIRVDVEGTKRYIDFDDAAWLTGSDADAAIRADGGYCPQGQFDCAPNGYYIQNTEQRSERLVLDPNARIGMIEVSGSDGASVYVADFDTFQSTSKLVPYWASQPFYVRQEKGVVTQVCQQYIP